MTLNPTDDLRIRELKPLVPPAILMEELPLDGAGCETVSQGRKAMAQVLFGDDTRLAVVAGPCSIHDPVAALEYAKRLSEVAERYREDLLVFMRVYFEKPRTIIGWKGLINDPGLDNSYRINEGLRKARGLLLQVARLGLPVGTEFLDPITPQFIADLVAWGAIGARTVESQVHRELASGLSMPVGFKNGTGGTVQIAVDAVRSAAHPHHFLSVTKQGLAAIVATNGNPECHLILRGGSAGPNYGPEAIGDAVGLLQKAGLTPRLMVDCSHANSGKRHDRQPDVVREVAEQLRQGGEHIAGVMLESFLEDGRQDHGELSGLTFGQSITDACMSWDRTRPLFDLLAQAVRERRERQR